MTLAEHRAKVLHSLHLIDVSVASQAVEQKNTNETLLKMDKRLDGYDKRISSNEKKTARQDGIMGVVMSLYAVLIGWVYTTKG